MGCRIPGRLFHISLRFCIREAKKGYLEDAEGLVAALEELAQGRLLLVAVVHDRLERLNRARDGARLDDADERAVEALARLEEGRVRRDLARALGRADGVARIEVVDEEGLHGFVWSGNDVRA